MSHVKLSKVPTPTWQFYQSGNSPSDNSAPSSSTVRVSIGSSGQQQPVCRPRLNSHTYKFKVEVGDKSFTAVPRKRSRRSLSDSNSNWAPSHAPRPRSPSRAAKVEAVAQPRRSRPSAENPSRSGSNVREWPIAYWPRPKVGPEEARGEDGKTYLLEGLYWREDAALSASQRLANVGKRTLDQRLTPKELERARLLPLPSHYGMMMLQEEREFKLAYDILRDCENPPRDSSFIEREREEKKRLEASRVPEFYKRITKNIFVGRRADKEDHPALCECLRPSDRSELGCTEACLNRLMQFTCSLKTCPCGEQCSNSPLEQRPGVEQRNLEVFWTGNRGFGLKTLVDIDQGDFIMEYCGEVISRAESYRRVSTTYKGWKAFYFLDYDGMEVVDAGRKGNETRFINHSCGPNTHVVRWKFANTDEYQMGIFALHDIPAGTELSYDYGWEDFSALRAAAAASAASERSKATGEAVATSAETDPEDDPSRQRCYCGADVCSGFLGAKKRPKPVVNSRGVVNPQIVVKGASTKVPPPIKKRRMMPTKIKSIDGRTSLGKSLKLDRTQRASSMKTGRTKFTVATVSKPVQRPLLPRPVPVAMKVKPVKTASPSEKIQPQSVTQQPATQVLTLSSSPITPKPEPTTIVISIEPIAVAPMDIEDEPIEPPAPSPNKEANSTSEFPSETEPKSWSDVPPMNRHSAGLSQLSVASRSERKLKRAQRAVHLKRNLERQDARREGEEARAEREDGPVRPVGEGGCLTS